MRKFKKIIRPLKDSGISISDTKIVMHEMFASAVCNAPDNEIDNFSAKRYSPVYLALCGLLENISKARYRRKNRRQK